MGLIYYIADQAIEVVMVIVVWVHVLHELTEGKQQQNIDVLNVITINETDSIVAKDRNRKKQAYEIYLKEEG